MALDLIMVHDIVPGNWAKEFTANNDIESRTVWCKKLPGPFLFGNKCKKHINTFSEKLQKMEKGAYEARPFVDEAIFCTFFIL